MPVECPNCRQPIPRIRLFLTAAWGRWRCSGCGALLGIDVRRRLLATIPWVGILFFLMFVARITSLGYAIAVPMLLAAGMLNYFLFDRAVVHERTGFRCRGCGYDLQGQVEPRCPECGSEFDLTELATHKAGGPKAPPATPWYRSALAVTLVMSIALILTIAGIIHLKVVRTRAARRQATLTQQTAKTVDSTITGEQSTTAPVREEDAAAEPKPP